MSIVLSNKKVLPSFSVPGQHLHMSAVRRLSSRRGCRATERSCLRIPSSSLWVDANPLWRNCCSCQNKRKLLQQNIKETNSCFLAFDSNLTVLDGNLVCLKIYFKRFDCLAAFSLKPPQFSYLSHSCTNGGWSALPPTWIDIFDHRIDLDRNDWSVYLYVWRLSQSVWSNISPCM